MLKVYKRFLLGVMVLMGVFWMVFFTDGVIRGLKGSAYAASLRDLGCYEQLYFNDADDNIYLFCDSTGDGKYDRYYTLGKHGLNLTPKLMELSTDEAHDFYERTLDRRSK